MALKRNIWPMIFISWVIDTVYALSAAHGYGVKTLLHELVKGLSSVPEYSGKH